jgi:serine/threonine protein kinase
MSPEQLEGRSADARTDIFSLGIVLHEMVAGARPFQATSGAGLIAAILTAEPPRLGSLRPNIPQALERVVKRCLAKDPDERWQTARDLAAELRWIAEPGSETPAPMPAGPPRRRGTPIVWLTAGLAVAERWLGPSSRSGHGSCSDRRRAGSR